MKKIKITLGIVAATLFAGYTAKAQCDSAVFYYHGDSVTTWAVPAGVTSLKIKLWAGGGGSGNFAPYHYKDYYASCGGSGAYLEGILSSPTLGGKQLTLSVPHGGGYSRVYSKSANIGGWPGGGLGGEDSSYNQFGGGGGGYAAVQIGSFYYAVAGGGGGGGSTDYGDFAYGGGGGGPNGDSGRSGSNYYYYLDTSGRGGTLFAGGNGGMPYPYNFYAYAGQPGSYLSGGMGNYGNSSYDYAGGGGGGGWYGGGGGGDYGNAGGGGSSYPGNTITTAGVTFTPTLNLEGTHDSLTYGNATAPGPHPADIGNGKLDSAGSNGMIVIYFYYGTAKTLSNIPCHVDTTGGIASVQISGGFKPYTYAWSNGGTTDTISNLGAGIYTVSVTDSMGCVATASTSITQPTVLDARAKQFGHILCFGDHSGSAAVSVTGGTKPYTYLWKPFGGNQDTATNLPAGNYTITVTDPCHDTAYATVSVTQPAQLKTNAKQIADVQCHGGNQAKAAAFPTGGSGAYTFVWNNADSTDTIGGLRAVTYSVHVTDSNGCSASSSVTITQPAPLTVYSSFTSDTGGCNGTAWMMVGGGTTPYTYMWNTGDSGDTITNQCHGTYCCTITDGHGCVNYDCATIISSVSVQNISGADAIKVYPDPNTGYFQVSGVQHGEVIELYNYMGQRISRTVADNNSTIQMDISNQANGIYMLRILDNNGKLVSETKLMKVQ